MGSARRLDPLRGLAGLENLALIPCLVGAAPIQNIGAYGTEIDEFIATVEAWDCRVWTTGAAATRGLRLYVPRQPLQARDRSLGRHGRRAGVATPAYAAARLPRRARGGRTLRRRAFTATVAAAVRRFRRRKLPDPAVIGNAGSFFKNPVVASDRAHALAASNPGLPSYPASSAEHRKLSAAWMIEACGWRGHRDGDAGVSSRHALVLVNHGGASGAQILSLVAARRGVRLRAFRSRART